MSIDPIIGIDLDYRIYSHPADQLKDRIEQVYQHSPVKGILFYKKVRDGARGRDNEDYIVRICSGKIRMLRIKKSLPYIGVIIALMTLFATIL